MSQLKIFTIIIFSIMLGSQIISSTSPTINKNTPSTKEQIINQNKIPIKQKLAKQNQQQSQIKQKLLINTIILTIAILIITGNHLMNIKHQKQKIETLKKQLQNQIHKNHQLEATLASKTQEQILAQEMTYKSFQERKNARKATLNIMGDMQKTQQQLLQEKKKAEESAKELRIVITELKQFNNLTMGRELRIIELKKEVNKLLEQNNQPKKYKNT